MQGRQAQAGPCLQRGLPRSASGEAGAPETRRSCGRRPRQAGHPAGLPRGPVPQQPVSQPSPARTRGAQLLMAGLQQATRGPGGSLAHRCSCADHHQRVGALPVAGAAAATGGARTEAGATPGGRLQRRAGCPGWAAALGAPTAGPSSPLPAQRPGVRPMAGSVAPPQRGERGLGRACPHSRLGWPVSSCG